MSDTKIKMKELGDEITDLKLKYEKLRSTYIKELQDKLGVLVGMSFKDEDGNYFRIIGIPYFNYDRARTSFNEYRFPALLCCNDPTIYADVGRLTIMTKYSRAAEAEDPVEYIKSEYTEVPPEKFDEILEGAFAEIKALGKRGDAK